MPIGQQRTKLNNSRKELGPWAAEVSAFRSASDTRGTTLPLIKAVRYATGEKQKNVILAIRRARSVARLQAKEQHLDERAAARLMKKATDKLKRGLWGFVPTGVYKGGRKRQHARERTEAVMVEADLLGGPKAARRAVEALITNRNVMAAWVSPSGDGVKILVWVQGGADHRTRHGYATEAVFGVNGPLYGTTDDTCYRNEHLLCFGSYDEEAHIRTSKLEPLVVPKGWTAGDVGGEDEDDTEPESDQDQVLDTAELIQALALIPPDCRFNPDLTERQEGEARDQWLRVGMAIHSKLPNNRGLAMWDKWSRGGMGVNALLGDVPDNYDAGALRTSWASFSDMGEDQGVTWATAVKLSRDWEKADAVRLMKQQAKDQAAGPAPKGKGKAEGDEEKKDIGELSANPEVLELVHYMVKAYFSQDCVRVSATGSVHDSSRNASLAAKRIAVDIRSGFRMQVSTSVVQDAIDVEAGEQASIRRASLIQTVVGQPKGISLGKLELRKWLRAVTGKVDRLDESVLQHILRNIKLKLSGLEAVDHKSLILYQLQRSGKSTAISRLVSPLADLVYNETSLKKLVDERGVRRFGVFGAIIWDEMAGARGRDTEDLIDTLKTLVTSNIVTYRPMGTNTDASMHNTATFFGSSNRPVAEVIKDPTGNRRFWQITTLSKIDWKLINSIDYDLVWKCIGIEDPSPIVSEEVDAAVMARHMVTRYKDPVEQWCEAGEWAELTDVRRPGSLALSDLPAVVAGGKYTSRDLYARFCTWCAAKGFDRPTNEIWFGRRLASIGWDQARVRSEGQQSRGYMAPIWI